jgi:hypothetical protein
MDKSDNLGSSAPNSTSYASTSSNPAISATNNNLGNVTGAVASNISIRSSLAINGAGNDLIASSLGSSASNSTAYASTSSNPAISAISNNLGNVTGAVASNISIRSSLASNGAGNDLIALSMDPNYARGKNSRKSKARSFDYTEDGSENDGNGNEIDFNVNGSHDDDTIARRSTSSSSSYSGVPFNVAAAQLPFQGN